MELIMKPKTAAILWHILDSLLLIAISTTLVLLIWVSFQSHFENFISWFSEVNNLFFIFILFVLPYVLAWQFPKTMMSVFRSIFLFPRHWGFAFNVFLGSGLTLGIAWRLDLIRGKYAWIILVYEIVIVLFCFVIARFHLYLHNKLKSVTIDSERDDRPIRTLDKNLIPEFENVAQRILGHLLLSTEDDNHGPNVALIGPFGSGKTSLCNLIKCIYNNPSDDQKKLKIIFCRFEAWQYLTADAAVRGLLDQIVGQIKEHVDSMQLATIPDKYLEALGACPHWFLNILSILLKRKPIPEEVVCSLQNILLRINRKVVVFVDDLDRLESRSIKAQDAVAAALNQLQNLTSVQYVLCVGSSMTTDTDKTPRKANYDLLKSTRFQELVPDMPSEDILNKIRALRDEAISLDENMYYVWNEKESDDPFKYNPMLEHLDSNMASQIMKLIQTPRQLKTVKRETREKWKSLKGEISWYDLVMINTIKACELPVFEWIITEKHIFLDGPLGFNDQSGDEKQKLRNSIEDRLKGRIFIKTQARFELVLQVLIDLFPNFMKGLGGIAENMTRREPRPWEQRLSFNPLYGVSYFERFKSGCVSKKEISDQSILQYIQKITRTGFEKSEFEEKFLDSFQKLTNDINRFRQFNGLLTRDLAIEVCDCILDWMCDRQHWSVWDPIDQYPSSVMLDVKAIIDDAGQFYVNRYLKRKNQLPGKTKNLQKWITERLETLLVNDVIVAYNFIHDVAIYHLEENIIKEIAGKITKSNFLNMHSSLWEKIKGSYNHLRLVLEMLNYNDGYDEIRDQVTNLVVEKIQANEPEELESSVVISLVHFGYPAGRPDLIDQYEFSVGKSKNSETYNMEKLLPLIKAWKNHEFKDPVVAKAFKHLLREYANELKSI